MNFNSIDFLIIFLPITFVVFRIVPQKMRVPVLLISSLIFYGVSGLVPLAFLILSICWGFGFALVTNKTKRTSVVLGAIAFPLLVLFLFKYLNFSLDVVSASVEVRDHLIFFLSVTLPAGISFYTFQLIAFNLDVHSGKAAPERDPIKIGAFIALFPQLIAGPILRYEQLSSQLDRVTNTKKLAIDYRSAFKFIAIGLFAKVCVSDLVGVLIGNSIAVDFATSGTQQDAFFLLFAYSIRIFFDFWAYSLIAIGLAKLFALDLPVNFLEPYQSLNPRDFWRRWHVTLSNWLRDYVYIKLGGRENYLRNITIVFLACGLWHGAGWTFILWGAYHAVLVLLYHFTQPVWDRFPKVLQVFVTFVLVSMGWPLFFMDLQSYVTFMSILFLGNEGVGIYGIKHWLLVGVIMAWVWLSRERVWLYNDKAIWVFDSPMIHGACGFIALILATYSNTFIYFRF
tara:strand:- start:518 stop:1879 length:1362 start_codon:yes stop_codon:yes gene_type:complete